MTSYNGKHLAPDLAMVVSMINNGQIYQHVDPVTRESTLRAVKGSEPFLEHMQVDLYRVPSEDPIVGEEALKKLIGADAFNSAQFSTSESAQRAITFNRNNNGIDSAFATL